MRNLSLLFTLMATVAIWNLTSCAGAGSTGTSASGSCVVSMDPYNDSLEQEKEELQRLEQEKAELQRQLEQEKAKQQRLEQEKAEQESYVGTFEITEEGKGNVRTIVLTVNDDETATMKYKDSEFIHYGSWYKYNHMKYAKFHFVEEDNIATSHSTIPHLRFDVIYNRELSNFVLMDGYLYSSSSAAEAKNPKERLKYKRVS